MGPEIGRAGFRIAFFVIFSSVCLLLLLPRGTAEFYITILTLLIATTFAGFVLFLTRVLFR